MHPAQTKQSEHALLKNYLLDHAYDEMFSGPGELHSHYEPLLDCGTPTPSFQRLIELFQAIDSSISTI